jgi:flagellar protein FlaG
MSEQIDAVGPIGSANTAENALRDGPSTPPPVPARAPRSATPAPASTASPAGNSSPRTPQQAVDQLNAALASANRVMRLSVDPATGLTVATISDAATGQVLQQIPSDELMRLAEMLEGWGNGKKVLVDLIA